MITSKYEMKCPDCNGSGGVDITTDNDEYIHEVFCPNCDGDGVIPNAEGLEILAFLKRYIND